MKHVYPIECLAGNIEILLRRALYIKHPPLGPNPLKQKNKEAYAQQMSNVCVLYFYPAHVQTDHVC